MPEDPIARFHRWYREAERRGARLPDAMALATVGPAGAPSVRFVLLKQADARGFVFFTDTRSRKGRELEKNRNVAASFHWPASSKQVRIEGSVEPVTPEEADEYWITRPRGSQLSATTSFQSAPIADRASLVARRAKVAERLRGRAVPRPPDWSGFRIVPERIEFWTHRADRLHHRELFERTGRGWRCRLLQP